MSHGSKHPSQAPAFVDALVAHGFDFFAGVPCSLLKGLVSTLETRPGVRYISATREDSALGMAAGAFMGGKRPMVLLQNSGLGVSVNALASLHTLYDLPVLMIISWRGEDRSDAPEHWMMGEIMLPMLDLMKIPHKTLSPERDAAAELAWAQETMDATQKPVALIAPAGVLE